MICINAADFYVLSALEDVLRVIRVLETTVGYPLLLRRRRRRRRRLPPHPPPPPPPPLPPPRHSRRR